MNQCLFVGYVTKITKSENKITTITLKINDECTLIITVPDSLNNRPLLHNMLLGVKGHINTVDGLNIIADRIAILDVKDYASAE